MGLFSDIFRAMGVLFLGLKDCTKMYSESVEGAERYIRWGQQRNDIRDYKSALSHCQKCNDADAPKYDLKLRRYVAQAEAYCGLVRSESRLYEERNQNTIAKRNALEAEILDLRARRDEQQAFVQSLQNEGSLIKAKDAQQRVEEIERHLERQTEQLIGGSMERELQAEYSQLLDLCNRYVSDFDICLGAITLIEELEERIREEAIQRLRNQMEQHISRVRSFEPAKNT